MSGSGSRASPTPSAALTHRDVLAIAVPIIFSNMTTPLIGFVDTTVIGRLGVPHLIGAVAVGAMIFNIVFVAFNFLRMGTTGLTAQAAGRGDDREISAMLGRGVAIAVSFGAGLLLLQVPIIRLAFWLVEPSAPVAAAARDYYSMRIWSAPAALLNFALLGWFIGLDRASLAFWLQLFLNGLNIALAIWFVTGLGLSVKGVGLAATLSEVSAAIAGLIVAAGELRRRGGSIRFADILDLGRLRHVLSVNGDIMIRSLALLFALSFFTAQGVKAGDITLAANAVLMQWMSLSAYLLDGFAFAAETHVGQSVGARHVARFHRAVRLSTVWAVALSALVSAFFWIAGPWIIAGMTSSAEVQAEARRFFVWAALTPIVGVWCFQLDGIFIGATRTGDMRNMMLFSLAIYLAAWAALTPQFGNHGLWAALLLFFAVRGLSLWARYPALVRALFPA